MSGDVVIGLEIHAQVSAKSKVFSSSASVVGGEANAFANYVDIAFPGMLPFLNGACIRAIVCAGLALGCKINRLSSFSRKHYFYPDLPQGYQITQYRLPVVGEGLLTISTEDGDKNVRIERIHLEQDAGKSVHDIAAGKTYVDFNRAGVGLMEIVSAPDMTSGEEAASYFAKVRSILKNAGVCSGNLEDAAMRADVNVSIRRPDGTLGVRREIKNLNSLRFIRQAVEAEVRDQRLILEKGGIIRQETRLFDPVRMETYTMRLKESAEDYRYIDELDIPPLFISDAFIQDCLDSLPESLEVRQQRYQALGIDPSLAVLLVRDIEVADYFDRLIAVQGVDAVLAASWVVVELFSYLRYHNCEMSDLVLSPERFAELILLVSHGSISVKTAKEVFRSVCQTGDSPSAVVTAQGLMQIDSVDLLDSLVDVVLDENPDAVAKYLSGKTNLLSWFVGQVLRKTEGRAKVDVVQKIVTERLQNRQS